MSQSQHILGLMEAEVQKLENQKARLEQEIAVLRRMLARANPSAPQASASRESTSNGTGHRGQRGKVTSEIVRVLRASPGLSSREVADQLDGKVPSTAQNPRKSLINTIANMVSRGKLVRDEDGLLFLPGGRPERDAEMPFYVPDDGQGGRT